MAVAGTQVNRETLHREGAFSFSFKRRGQEVSLRVDQAELDIFTGVPIEEALRSIPKHVKLLCVHCTDDDRVPVCDVAGYVNSAPQARLHLIQGGSHEYREQGVSDALWDTWKAWFTEDAVAPARGAARL